MSKNGRGLKQKIEAFFSSDTASSKIIAVLLALLFMAGVLAIAAIAPNIFQIFGKKRFNKKQIRKGIYYLKKKGYVEQIEGLKDNKRLRLSLKGEKRLFQFLTEKMQIKKPNKWDGKWQVVIFDIPIQFNKARDALRGKLKLLGFYQFQKSAWIYPYPCFDEIVWLAKFYNVEQFVELLSVERMIKERKLREYFKV